MKKILCTMTKIVRDILEIYIPAIMFMTLFITFVLGVVFRYVIKNPQSWTYELSSIAFLWVGILGWGLTHRENENVVFEMLYERCSERVQTFFRILSNLLIAITAGILIVPSITYLVDMLELSTQILKIPRYLVFLPFAVSFIIAFIRSTYRLIPDIKLLSEDVKEDVVKLEEEN